jgi:hypothetical protein
VLSHHASLYILRERAGFFCRTFKLTIYQVFRCWQLRRFWVPITRLTDHPIF